VPSVSVKCTEMIMENGSGSKDLESCGIELGEIVYVHSRFCAQSSSVHVPVLYRERVRSFEHAWSQGRPCIQLCCEA
jgi:hypothetical protein